ncbi:porphobilinogen deaminase [Kitasatospora xanthocidica]|uniref:hydroxymethylbilane synthase n=1 Tax=Kitasatospora xanthocidica TaxID=83382 RepID=UPI0016799F08|nr:hydroxymethylbilane synthase [Kitasatospora xanthocidica]GHF91045.1 porphobilinogen deaminase [Kitasatospora xanthocidica]
MRTLVVGSRASHLARAQVREFLAPLWERCPDVAFRQRVITEAGDQDRRSALRDVSERGGGSAFSVNQVNALVSGEVDVIVHSLKDLPTANPPGLILLPPPTRADVHDALCGSTLAGLPLGGRIGTSASRRIAQLLHVRPDLVPVEIRGNVPTRLCKLKTQQLDAVVLAAAGIKRLGRGEEISEILPIEQFPPSPGQGALGIQIREDNELARRILAGTGDPVTDAEVRAERAMLAELHGGCSVPVGALGRADGEMLTLHGQVTSVDGRRQVEASFSGPLCEPEKLGVQVADLLLDQGAEGILAEARIAA